MKILRAIANKLLDTVFRLMGFSVGGTIEIEPVTPNYITVSQLQRILDEREQARKAAEDIAYFDEEP
jgi:hypothetical protein